LKIQRNDGLRPAEMDEPTRPVQTKCSIRPLQF
jgi:hypothetical protein